MVSLVVVEVLAAFFGGHLLNLVDFCRRVSQAWVARRFLLRVGSLCFEALMSAF